jgi:glycosyltransferase involved in cell wall biosynthesis
MCELLLRALADLGFPARLSEKRLSASVAEVARPSPRKVARGFAFLGRVACAAARHRPALAIVFIAPAAPAFYLDAMAIVLLRLARRRYVLYLHARTYGRLLEARWPTPWLARDTFRHAASVVTLAECIRSDAERLAPPGRVAVIPNGVDAEVRARPLDGGGPLNVLYMGTMKATKGALEAVVACVATAASGAVVHLAVAGDVYDPDYDASVRRAAAQIPAPSSVRFVGHVEGREKQRLFESADVFVYPSQLDATPLVVTEAMAAGLPVIASREGGLPCMVLDGVTGFVVDPPLAPGIAQRLGELDRDRALLAGLGRAGRMRYEANFSYPAYREAWGALLQRLLRLEHGPHA